MTNPNTRTTRESGGSTFISAIADGLGNLGDAEKATESLQPIYSDPWQVHDGADDRLVFTFGSRTADMRVYQVVRTTDTQWISLGSAVSGSPTAFVGVAQDGSSGSPADINNSGSPTYHVDGGAALSSPTRDDLHTALADGAAHILEIRGVHFTHTDWASAQFCGYRDPGGDTNFILDGDLGPVLIAETANISAATHDEIMSILADTYRVTLA